MWAGACRGERTLNLTSISLRGARGPSDLAVDEGFDCLDGGGHEGLGGTGERADDPAPFLVTPFVNLNRRFGAARAIQLAKRAGSIYISVVLTLSNCP